MLYNDKEFLRQGIFEVIKYCGSPKIAKICNFLGIKFSWISPYICSKTCVVYYEINFHKLDGNHENQKNL